ncbi:hypothetical protein [Acinetobacter sp. Marseille-Q1618]|uniref:hypothetical protein n=1 Tax=Acinetobacter sp. Marseille-Q1618 TaxID=2697502 RepID=UPI00156DC051|nr:hypothetical protein [Acinetobacter sp. Marseille-Q1618]
MNTPIANNHYVPSVQEIRHSLCSQLIGAGLKTATDIVDTAKAIEAYVFDSKAQAELEMRYADNNAVQSNKNIEEPKTETQSTAPVAEQKTVEAVAIETNEVAAEEAPQFTFDDVKAALMRVAKVNRDKLKGILDQVGAENVPAIHADKYAVVMQLAEGY